MRRGRGARDEEENQVNTFITVRFPTRGGSIGVDAGVDNIIRS